MVIMDEPFFFSPVSFSVKTRATTPFPAEDIMPMTASLTGSLEGV